MELSRSPIIDFSHLHSPNPETRAKAIDQIATACRTFGFFNVINHGISDETIRDAVDANRRFEEAPPEVKEALKSGDVYQPVRFGTVLDSRGGHGSGCGTFVRDFLKLYSFPLEDWIEFWPSYPTDYRSKMGKYSKETRNLSISLLKPMLESLHITDPSPLLHKVTSEGMQMMAVNHYHTGLQQQLSNSAAQIGIPPHTDHTLITVLLQTSPGLHVLDPTDGNWKEAVAPSEIIQGGAQNTLQVLVGDQLEVLSNGRYRGAVHRVSQCSPDNCSRISVASLLSFGMDEVVEPAAVMDGDELLKPLYKGRSLRDLINHLASGEKLPFIETLRIMG
ncbi:unnamed protein product [Linum trigynum]|uniref:Fe2OG dioxygenase domain-containing protein n=1 Tax=Linum trigynum TaxID=586398 RepID=A0AAV2DQW7_9ROSI